MNNQVDMRNIQSSSCNISSNQALKFSLSKGLESNFPLFLRYISVEYLTFLVNISVEHDLIAFLFTLTEQNGSSSFFSSIAQNYVRNSMKSFTVITVYSQMLDIQWCLIFKSQKHINKFSIFWYKLFFNLFDPTWDCGWKQ